MSRARQLTLPFVVLLLTSATHVVRADFSASGRRQKGHTAARGNNSQPRTRVDASEPSAKPTPATDGAGSSAALIARYTAIALSQPGVAFPIERLAQLVRERDGKLDRLVDDFERRAAEPGADQWNARMALAGIYKQAGKSARAVDTLQAALRERPGEPAAHLALGQLYLDRGDKSPGRAEYEAALPLLKNPTDREQTLRTLLGLCLDLQDFDQAERYHKELIQHAGGSFFVRSELARELLARGYYDRAERQYRDLVNAATGDNRALGPALRDLGQALAKQNKRDEALKVLQRALAVAGDQSGLRHEIFDQTAAIYRAENRLNELIALMEREHPADFERRRMLGELYEETGRIDKALATYRSALAKKPTDVSTRLKVVQLLQAQGDLGQAISENERLIAASPGNTDLVFQLAEALLQQGNRSKALACLRRLEAKAAGDTDTSTALVDFYERIGEHDLALHLLERLAQRGVDPEPLIELGNRYFEAGDKQRAEHTWKRVLGLGKNRAAAYQRLAEVYLEHDMADSALQALHQAMELEPERQSYKQAYAVALERSGAAQAGSVRLGQYEDAERIWQDILQSVAPNEPAAEEARRHLVTLWSLAGDSPRRLRALEERIEQSPPDLQAARLLAQAQLRGRSYVAAERTLDLIVKNAPGDVPSLLDLERVLASQQKLEAASAILQRLTEVDPKRAGEYTERMARYATELYQDERAVELTKRAVELNPDDAEGHRRLAALYRNRQRTGEAVAELRLAIAKNDRLFPAYFDLAELLLNQNDVDAAETLLRRVLRAASDDESIARAARLGMQIDLGRGTLESLEQDLLPLALGNPARPVYRRLLVELYGALVPPLERNVATTQGAERDGALAALESIGRRAVKPLLDTLNDDQDNQQRAAVDLLTLLHPPSAAPALFAFATGSGDAELRARAMVAAGSLDAPLLVPKLEALLTPQGSVDVAENDPVSLAAIWALGHVRSPKATPVLLKLTHADSHAVRALAALGLGFSAARSGLGRLLELALDPNESELSRASAAFALADLGWQPQGAKLQALFDLHDPQLRSVALIALARVRVPGIEEHIADGLISGEREVERAARAAALILSTRVFRANAPFASPPSQVGARQILTGLVVQDYSADEEAAAFAALERPIRNACNTAVKSSPERAINVVIALMARGGKPAFGGLTQNLDTAAPEARRHAEQTAERVATSLITPLLDLLMHPAPNVRATVVSFLGTREEPAAQKGVLTALHDPAPEVRQAALTALRGVHDEVTLLALLDLLTHEQAWPMRSRVIATLRDMPDLGGTIHQRVVAALAASALHDDTALVRQAALSALNQLDRAAARPVLTAALRDDEARLRETAQTLLNEAP